METSDIQKRLLSDKRFRTELTSQSHAYFFSTYFPHFITAPTADFQKEILQITESSSPLAVICAFRNSGKSTYATMSYPIWAVVGVQQKKFVVIASQTQYQAKMHLTNIKRELEGNELLASDLGPFMEQREEWGSTSLYIPKYNARITAVSTEQSIRGIRHGAFRPDLIICDDVEDMTSVNTREGRNKTDNWFTGEVVPAGDSGTKRLVVGNLLHEDSLLMRLKERIENNEIDGLYREWPVVKNDRSLWPGKYPDKTAINVLRRTVGNKIAWEREYMLRIIPDDDQVIDPRWIRFYEELPAKTDANQYINSFISVDLAIKQTDRSDYTAIVIIHVYGNAPADRRYYIDKRFINKRLTSLQTLDAIESIYHAMQAGSNRKPLVIVESNQYQSSVVDHLSERGIEARGVHAHNDKRARLQMASPPFEMGAVFFPKSGGAKDIIQQLVGFGVEKHDDLADAVSMGLNFALTKIEQRLAIIYKEAGGAMRNVATIRYKD